MPVGFCSCPSVTCGWLWVLSADGSQVSHVSDCLPDALTNHRMQHPSNMGQAIPCSLTLSWPPRMLETSSHEEPVLQGELVPLIGCHCDPYGPDSLWSLFQDMCHMQCSPFSWGLTFSLVVLNWAFLLSLAPVELASLCDYQPSAEIPSFDTHKC